MNKTRLQFRHEDSLFANRALAIDFLASLVDENHVNSIKFGDSLYAEPLVVKYTDEDGDEQAILAIGLESGHTEYHIIDTADIYGKIASNSASINDEIARATEAENVISESLSALSNTVSSGVKRIARIQPTESDLSVKEEYALIDSSETPVEFGDHIKIYNDCEFVTALFGYSGATGITDAKPYILNYGDDKDTTKPVLYLVNRTQDKTLSLIGVDFSDYASVEYVQDLLNALDNAHTITSNDIVVSASTSGINLSIQVDNKTIVKEVSLENGKTVFSTSIKMVEVEPSGPNVKSAYELQDKDGNKIGDRIEVKAETSLFKHGQGHVGDEINPANGEYIKFGDGDETMNFIYFLSDGSYSLTQVNIGSYFTETRFGEGINITSANTVNIKTGDGNEYLVIGEDTISVIGVNAAIASAKTNTISETKEYTDAKAEEIMDSVSAITTANSNSIEAINNKVDETLETLNGDVNSVGSIRQITSDAIEMSLVTDGLIATTLTVEEAKAQSLIREFSINGKNKYYVSNEATDMYYQKADGTKVQLNEYISSLENRIVELENKFTTSAFTGLVLDVMRNVLSGKEHEIDVIYSADTATIAFSNEAIFGDY